MPDFMELFAHGCEMVGKGADEKNLCEFRRLNTDRKKREADPAFVGALARTDDKRRRQQSTGHKEERDAQLFQISFIVECREDSHTCNTEQDGNGLDHDILDAVSCHRRMHGRGDDDNPHDGQHQCNDSERTVDLTEMRTDGIRECGCSFDGFSTHLRSDSFLVVRCGISHSIRFLLLRG